MEWHGVYVLRVHVRFDACRFLSMSLTVCLGMGYHGNRLFSRGLFGSVAQRGA